MLTPELRHASALPDLPTYLTCPAFAVLCPPSVSCSRLLGPRSYPCLCPAPSTPAKRPKWPSEPALIARLLPIPFDAVAWHHPTTLDAESLSHWLFTRVVGHAPGIIIELLFPPYPLTRMEHEKMTPERFRQVRNLFEAALEKQPAEREVFVDEAAQSDQDLRAEVERMLDAHQRTVTFLDGSVAAPTELRTDPRRMEGRRLGPYEILREIGRGGMGTVYLGRRNDGLFQQRVAIKVVTPETAGGEIIQRFEQERQILASLEHPNIARIYDGGSTEEGWPYFVMEYEGSENLTF